MTQVTTIKGNGVTVDGKTVTGSGKLSHKQFTYKAIRVLRKEGYKGIHSVFSGFNAAFKEYFATDPIVTTTALQKAGDLVVVPAKKGVMLYIPGDAPERVDNRGKAVLAQIMG